MRLAMAWLGALLLASACTVVPGTPLTRAAASGDAAEISALTAQGARPDDADGNGVTPLAYAARRGHLAAIEALIDAGASADLPDSRNGWTPLLHAIHKRQPEAVRVLLGRGAGAGTTPRGGVPPIVMAAGYGHTEIVRLLLDAGADPRATAPGGVNALWAAAGGGALADITDGPSIGSCFPETIQLLRGHAPDLVLPEGAETKAIEVAAGSKECADLIAGLRAP